MTCVTSRRLAPLNTLIWSETSSAPPSVMSTGIGRQDDETGYLGELRGGTFAGDGDPETVAGAFLEAWGPSLFGVGATELAFLRDRVERGHSVADFPRRERELLAEVARTRAATRPG